VFIAHGMRVDPNGTVTVAGTVPTAGLELVSATTAPPGGAPPLRTTFPPKLFPPTTVPPRPVKDCRTAGETVRGAVRVVEE
jgi:hypothetical protein